MRPSAAAGRRRAVRRPPTWPRPSRPRPGGPPPGRAAAGTPRRGGRSRAAGRPRAGRRWWPAAARRRARCARRPRRTGPLSPLPQKPSPSSQKSVRTREAVVEVRHVDVRRLEVGPRPQMLARARGGRLGHVLPLVPGGPAVQRAADRLDPDRRASGRPGAWSAVETTSAVTPSTAMSQSNRHSGSLIIFDDEVVVHRQVALQDGLRVALGVAPRVERDGRELLARRAELVHVARRPHAHPRGAGERPERQHPLQWARDARPRRWRPGRSRSATPSPR